MTVKWSALIFSCVANAVSPENTSSPFGEDQDVVPLDCSEILRSRSPESATGERMTFLVLAVRSTPGATHLAGLGLGRFKQSWPMLAVRI